MIPIMTAKIAIEPINVFLQYSTPQSWIDEATKPENIGNLLRAYANYELKA